MGDVLTKILFLVVILPVLMAREGWGKLKAYLERRHGVKLGTLELTLAILIIVLIILFLNGFGL